MDDPKQSDDSHVSDDSNQTQTQQPHSPGAPKLKEQAPVSADQKVDAVSKLMQMGESDAVAKSEKDEYWENYSREIELEKEVLELGGIEKIDRGEVDVPPQLASEMGIKAVTDAHSPMQSPTGFSVSGVSLDDSQLSQGMQKPTSSGFRWIVEWFIYELLKAHYHVKKVKNKIVRSKD